jgi:hypothetical protein
VTEPEITVSGDPGVEAVRKARNTGEIKEPSKRSTERKIT